MMNKLGFLTKISLKKKIASKWFLLANLFIVIGAIALVNVDTIIKYFGGDFNEENEILVIDNTNNYYESFSNNLIQYNSYLNEDETIKISKYEDTVDSLKDDLEEDTNKILIVINQDEKNYINAEIISYEGIDTVIYQTLTMTLNSVRQQVVLDKYNITPEMQAEIEMPVEITRTRLDDGDENEEMMDLLGGVIFPLLILPFFMLTMYLVQMIGAEVNEEKTTKSMEIIISNVSPKVHFFSKIIAGNLFVLIQSLIILVSSGIGLIVRYFINDGDMLGEMSSQIGDVTSVLTDTGIMDKIGVVLPITIVIMFLTFIAYSLLSGILASMTTNVEDYQQLQTPIALISVIGYYLAMMSFMFEGSTFIKVVSYIPLISSLLAPSLLVMGQIGVIDIIISLVILIIFIFFLFKYGLRIYKVGILNYSSTGLLKKMFKAMKEK